MRLNKACTGSYKIGVTTNPAALKAGGRMARKLPGKGPGGPG